jgi:hypothetical protein
VFVIYAYFGTPTSPLCWGKHVSLRRRHYVTASCSQPLFGEFPNGNGPRNVNVQTANDAQLWYFETRIDHVQQLHRDPFLLLAQQYHRRLLWECVGRERAARRRLFNANNPIALLSPRTEPHEKILLWNGPNGNGLERFGTRT